MPSLSFSVLRPLFILFYNWLRLRPSFAWVPCLVFLCCGVCALTCSLFSIGLGLNLAFFGVGRVVFPRGSLAVLRLLF